MPAYVMPSHRTWKVSREMARSLDASGWLDPGQLRVDGSTLPPHAQHSLPYCSLPSDNILTRDWPIVTPLKASTPGAKLLKPSCLLPHATYHIERGSSTSFTPGITESQQQADHGQFSFPFQAVSCSTAGGRRLVSIIIGHYSQSSLGQEHGVRVHGKSRI
jgi:hypothetical protein